MGRFQFILLAACLIGPGCTSTGKKPPATSNPRARDRAEDSMPFWADGKSPARNNGTSPRSNAGQEVEGVIAGMLIDSNGKPQTNALVNVTLADAGLSGKPIGVQADDQGYFMIKGLKSGSTYFLAVRGEDGSRVLGGSAMTQAPNTRMLIRLSEGNVSSVTPPAQPNPGATGPFAPEKKDERPKLVDPPTSSVPPLDPAPKDPLTGSDQSWSPGKTPPTSRPIAPPPPASTRTNPNIAGSNNQLWPPTANIPAPLGTQPRVEPPPPPASPSMSAVPSNSSPLSVTPVQQRGPRLNFAVYDLTGEPIEFRRLSNRRLIVMDFWSTTCSPCLQKIPGLIDLQSRYSDYIDIVGVACDTTPWAKRKKDVEGIKDYYLHKTARPINYNLYLEGNGQEGKLRHQFHVTGYPTAVLLDYTGKELWRGSDTRQLEEAIRFYLQR